MISDAQSSTTATGSEGATDAAALKTALHGGSGPVKTALSTVVETERDQILAFGCYHAALWNGVAANTATMQALTSKTDEDKVGRTGGGRGPAGDGDRRWMAWLWSSNETSRSSSRNTPTATNGATIRNNLAPSSEQHLVAIVGAAHVPGIAAEWEKLQREVSVAGLRSLPHLTQRNYNQIRSDHFEALQPARIKDLHEVEVCILFSSFW